MILFVFEGKDDKNLFSTIQQLFFSRSTDHIVCTFNNNIYVLYDKMLKLGEGADIVLAMKENNDYLRDYCSGDFSEVFLFFDYDFHHCLPLDELNSRVATMLDFFNDETGNGKLYINYPMLEAIRYIKSLPDPNYTNYIVTRSDCKHFKRFTHEFSCFKGVDFIQLKCSSSEKEINKVRSNWELLKTMNAQKANFICNGIYEFPKRLNDIRQQKIFTHQVDKFVSNSEVSILSAYPLFLLEYFGV